MTGTALDLKGRTAKAHIDKWQQYGEKSQQHATSAAILLLEAKVELKHGAFTPWLQRYDIAPRTARQLMLEYKVPGKQEERKSRDREYRREVTIPARSRRFVHTSTSGDEPYAPSSYLSPTEAEAYREAIIAYVKEAPAFEIERLYRLLLPTI